ncbi:MAG: protein-L-isoaspartate O-methyltransferase [Parvularculaceae bacterium]
MDFQAARRHMVDNQVRTNDVPNLRLQKAMEETPRELFLPADLRGQAYVERELEYAPGRRMLTPRDFAKLVAAADPVPGDLVLDVACGAGYSTAILAELAEMVVATEKDEALAAAAQENLATLGVANAAVVAGDPWAGAPEQGPYDVIFVGAAIEREPEALLVQLKDGGRLAAIMKIDGVSKGVIYRKSGEACSPHVVFSATATRILPGFEAARGFRF